MHENYDDSKEEVSMVTTELKSMIHDATELLSKMPSQMHVEPWVQAKVAMAKASICSIHDYIVYGNVNEEVEQIDELSKKTLVSYIDKATSDVHNKAYNAGKKEGATKTYDVPKITGSIMRQLNIKKAANKLANEGAEVDRMEKHIETSEIEAGKSPKVAKQIAWATINKRGMLKKDGK
jgi:hypothetical protein